MRSTSKCRINTGIVVACMACGILGCSDNPQNRGAKEAHQQSRQAVAAVNLASAFQIEGDQIKTVDMAAVHAQNRQKIQNALKSAGPAKAAASLASADLAWSQAIQLRMGLIRFDPPAKATVAELNRKLLELGRLQTDRQELQIHIDTTDQQMAQLEKTLTTGDEKRTALNDQRASVAGRLEELEKKRSELISVRDQLQQKGNDLQRQGEETLKKADQMAGDEKLQVQQQGYDLLLSKKQLYIETQDKTDQIAGLESEIAIVKPRLDTIQAQITQTQAKIQSIRDSENLKTIKVQLTDTDKQITQCKERISWLFGDLKSTHENYAKAIDEILSVLNSGVEDCGAADSRETAEYASARLANLHYEAAQTTTQAVGFLAGLFGRITAASALVPEDLAPAVKELTASLDQSIADFASRGLEQCDLSSGEYEKLSGRGSKSFASDIAKEQLLTLYTKRSLAEQINKTDVVAAVNARAKEIMDPLIQEDPTFAQTLTAQLFSGSQAYKPQMAINMDLYAEDLVRKFQGWKTLRGTQAEAEVNKLLAQLEAMSKVESPVVMEKLKVEWDALRAAKEKGFAEAQQPADANTPAPR
ncbi:MAG: hypothetical protein GX455_14565 [Phycisphaerae bacterium]|nr:hypothetical protein [Phycisphaerae bacterium]